MSYYYFINDGCDKQARINSLNSNLNNNNIISNNNYNNYHFYNNNNSYSRYNNNDINYYSGLNKKSDITTNTDFLDGYINVKQSNYINQVNGNISNFYYKPKAKESHNVHINGYEKLYDYKKKELIENSKNNSLLYQEYSQVNTFLNKAKVKNDNNKKEKNKYFDITKKNAPKIIRNNVKDKKNEMNPNLNINKNNKNNNIQYNININKNDIKNIGNTLVDNYQYESNDKTNENNKENVNKKRKRNVTQDIINKNIGNNWNNLYNNNYYGGVDNIIYNNIDNPSNNNGNYLYSNNINNINNNNYSLSNNDKSNISNKNQKYKYTSVNKHKEAEKLYNNYQQFDIEPINKPISYPVSNKPKGLYNLGLSCYMNSLLQCLYYIPELRNYFIDNKNTFYNKPVCKAFAEVMYGLKYDKKEYYEPIEFKRIIGSENDLFSGVNAGDAKDLYFSLIHNLLNQLTIEEDNNESDQNIDFKEKIQVFKETEKEVDKNNIINKLFIGFYEMIYKCGNKRNVYIYSFSYETFILFNLENISNYYRNKELTIDDCFEYNFNRRYKTDFSCSECKMPENNISEGRIYRPPEILVLILDRGKGKKFRGNVSFGIDLNIDYLIDEENYKKKYSSKYKLIGVSTHSGTSSASGHYTACCLTDNGKYYYFSDTYVQEVSESELYRNEPYLLFYRRL